MYFLKNELAVQKATYSLESDEVPTTCLIQGLTVMMLVIPLWASSRGGGGRCFWNLRSSIKVNVLRKPHC